MKSLKLNLIVALSVMAMAVSCSTSADEERQVNVSDEELFDMSMRLYDSLTTDSFFRMYKEALLVSKQAGSERYYITTQRMLVSRYSVLKDIPAFISESDRVIRECKRSETPMGQTMLYATWNFKADRLDAWGMKEEALQTASEMSDYALEHQHTKGLAMAQYLYGGFYLNAHQLEEAEACLDKAWSICGSEGYRDLMVKVGFSRLAVMINEERYDEGLAVADTVRSVIAQREASGQKIAPVTRLKLAKRLCSIYCGLGEIEKAEAQRDTMMIWYGVDQDRSQLISVLHADANVKYHSGKYEEAIPVLDSIIHLAERNHNWAEVSDNTYALASAQLKAGMKEESISSFERFAEAKDSAIVQDSRQELDNLTKKYELAELALAARNARTRAEAAFVAVFLLLLVIGFYILYTKRLLEKNKALYEKVKDSDQKTAEVSELSVKDKNTPLAGIFRSVNDLMAEKKLYKDAGLNRDSLAAAVGTNSKYLAEAIKEFSDGRTVNDLINWWRLQEASKILSKDTDMPIAVVGEESGFGSSQTFFRIFKEHYGMTPSDYRKAASRAIS